jgi:DnaJ-class molecular chaperone
MLKRVRFCRTCQNYQGHVDRFLLVFGSTSHFLSWSGADTEEELEHDPRVCTDSRDLLTVDLHRFFFGGRSRAALYKTKCSGCHGAGGEGKAATKAPALKGMTLDAGQIEEQIRKGKRHHTTRACPW